LIYRLVMRRGYSGGWPVVDSPEWQALGRGAGGAGAAWRDLCNRLLDRSLETEETPAITVEQLPGLIPAPSAGEAARRKRNLLIAIAAALVIGGGGGVAWRTLRHHEPPPTFALIGADPAAGAEALTKWRELVACYYPRQGWVDPFVQAIAPDRKIRDNEAAGIEALKRTCADLVERARPLATPQNKPPQIAGRAEDAGVFWEQPAAGSLNELASLLQQPGSGSFERYRYLGDAAIAQTKTSLGEIERFEKFVIEEWRPGLEIAEAQGKFDGRGWKGAAGYLAGLVSGLKNAFEKPDAPGAEAGQGVAPSVVQMAEQAPAVREIEKQFGELSNAGSVGAGSGDDPVLGKLAAAIPDLVKEGLGEGAEAGSVAALAARVQVVRKLVDDVRGYVREDRKPALDRREMARQIAANRLAEAPASERTLRTWLTLAEGSLMAGEHPSVKLQADVGEVEKLVQAYATSPSNKQELETSFAGELAGVKTAIGGLAERSYVSGTKAEVDRLSAEVAGRLAKLDAGVKTETAAALERERLGLEGIRNELRTAAEWDRITGSPAVNREWQKRRDAMVGKAAAGVTVRWLDDERRRVRQMLQKLDQGVMAAPAPVAADGEWGALLAQAAAGNRDRAIEAAVAGLASSSLSEAEVMVAATEASRACEGWLRKAEALKADMAALNGVLCTEFSLGAKAAGGGGAGGGGGASAEAIWEKWKADEFTRDPAVAKALEPLGTRVEAHRAVAKERSPETLLATVRGSGEGAFDVAVAAWEKLIGDAAAGGLAWPKSAAELEQAASAAASVRALVEKAERDPARRAAATGRMQQRAAACWTGFARRQLTTGAEGAADAKPRAQAFLAAVAAMEKFGVAADGIADPQVRINVLLAGFASGFADASDDAVRQATAELRQKIESVKGAEPSDPRLAAVLTDLRNRIETPPKVTPVEQLGPGGKGFAAKGRFEGGRITFTIAEGQDVTFVAVDRPEGTVFLAEQEASLDLFKAVIDKAGLSGVDVINNGWLGDRPERPEKPDEEWSGPRVWKWSKSAGGYKLAAGGAWFDTRGNSLQKFQANPAYPDVVADPSKRPDPKVLRLPAGMGEEPSEAMPMERVTPKGAAAACEVMGCRLPTESEWKAGLATLSQRAAVGGAPVYNLRDQAFKRQEDYMRPLRDGGTVSLDYHRLPDEGSYDYTEEKVGAAHPFSDGYLWFWPVAAGPSDQPLKNMVGNVGEIVTTDARAGYVVLGGSALSRVENPIDKAVPIDEAGAFWDVGFRPAFSSKDRVPDPLRVQAKQILTERLGETMLMMGK
jgi:hypothetical protein